MERYISSEGQISNMKNEIGMPNSNYCICHDLPTEFCSKSPSCREISSFFNKPIAETNKQIIPVHLSNNIRTTKDNKYLTKVELLLKRICKKKKEEYVIGMLSNHSSTYCYILIPKKQLEKELKQKSTAYPRLNLTYYDLDWFKTKLLHKS